MPDSLGKIITPIISGIFAYVVARRQSATEIRKLKDAQVQHNIIEGDFKAIIDWFGSVGEITTATSTESLISYKRDPFLTPSVLLLDARYHKKWTQSIDAIDASIAKHRSLITRLDKTTVLTFRELQREVMWYYEKQRNHLSAGKIRMQTWRMHAGLSYWWRRKHS